MPAHSTKALHLLKTFGLSLPGTQPKSPWPGHDDVAVNDKTFAYLSGEGGRLAMSVKLPVSGPQVLLQRFAAPTGYGLGKSGWVTIEFPAGEALPVPIDTLKRWMMESYRAQAPKRMLKALEAAQPWVRAGELPDPLRT